MAISPAIKMLKSGLPFSWVCKLRKDMNCLLFYHSNPGISHSVIDDTQAWALFTSTLPESQRETRIMSVGTTPP